MEAANLEPHKDHRLFMGICEAAGISEEIYAPSHPQAIRLGFCYGMLGTSGSRRHRANSRPQEYFFDDDLYAQHDGPGRRSGFESLQKNVLTSVFGEPMIEYVELESVTPLHKPRSDRHLQNLTAEMKENGRKGRPLLVIERDSDYLAWTGSHRIAAARLAGLTSIPCYILPESKLTAVGFDAEWGARRRP